MSSTRAVAHSTLWQIASQITMAALSIVTVKFVAMGLSKELAGEYNTAYGYLQIFGILADFGLYAVAVREVSRASAERREHVLGALMILRIAILFLSLGSALMIAWIVPQWSGTPLPPAIAIAAFVPFFTLLAGMLRTVFQIHYKMKAVFIAEVTQRVITVSLTGAIIFLGVRETTDERILYAFLGIGGIGAAFLFLFSALYAARLMRLRLVWDRDLLRKTIILAAPYGLAFLCTALYRQFDVTLIGLLRPDHELQNAYYGFVQRAMDMAYIFPTFLLNSTLPLLSERDAKGEDTRDFLGSVLFAVLLLGTTAFLFATMWPRPLTELLTTESYLSAPGHPGSDTAMGILSVSMAMNGLIVFAFYSLLTKHAWKPLVTTLFCGAILSLAMNALLIPSLGFVGAAITSASIHVLLAAVLLPQSFKRLPFRLSREHVRQWILYSAGLAAFLFVAQPFLTRPIVTAAMLGAAGVWMAGVAWGVGMQKTLRI